MALDYKKNIEVEVVTDVPRTGLWVPISVAAQMAGYSEEMIRHLYKNEIMKSIRFERGPILVNYEEMHENWVKPIEIKKAEKESKKAN